MSHDLICAWLGLPAGVWPPDHYSLLGLTPGENDPKLIEERVYERLDAVRRYQMIHPEQATEAMNRIAQAFVCLSEPASKRVYDVALLGSAAEQPAALAQTATAVEDRDPLVLVYNPTGEDAAPPVRLQYDPTNQETAPPIRRAASAPEPILEAIPFAVPIEEPPHAIPLEPIVEVMPPPRGGETKRELYHCIAQTRRLSEMWNQAGKYLASPKRRLTRVTEINNLLRVLTDIREKLRSFPPFMGEAGQPGYQVLALAQLTSAPMFQALEPSQREMLSTDWQAGKQALEAHRASLRQDVLVLRKRNLFQRLGRAVRNTFVEKPGRVLVALAVLALFFAIIKTYIYPTVERIVITTAENVLSSGNGRPHSE
jgi:hypothetical protein